MRDAYAPHKGPLTDPLIPFRIHTSNTNTFPFRVRAFPRKSWEQLARGKKYRRTTITILSEDTLLEIFDFYRLDAMQQTQSPWKWHRLAHVCRKWRHVISMSPHRLDLRILCKPEAPFWSILCSWPTLPLVVRYNARSWESAHMPRSIMIALSRSDRTREINLDVTSSMTGPVVNVIRKACQALESIRITVIDVTGSPKRVRNAFLGGSAPHLRELKLDGIAFPFRAIRQVLLSTNNLVELDLSNTPVSGYFSPHALVAALSASVKLRRLTIGFHYPASLPIQSRTSPPPQYVTLPSLVFLGFHGASEYLEELVAQVGLPALHDITIRLFNQIFFEIPQFCQFISRLDALESPNLVMVTYSVESVKVSLIQTGKSLDGDCILSTSCRRLDWQLSFVTQILNQFSPLLSSIRSLSFEKSHELPTGEEDMDSTQWLELLQPFSHVSQVLVWEKQLLPGIVQALATEDTEAGVLPRMTSLYLSEYSNFPYVAKAAKQFVSTRRLSGRTVYLYG